MSTKENKEKEKDEEIEEEEETEEEILEEKGKVLLKNIGKVEYRGIDDKIEIIIKPGFSVNVNSELAKRLRKDYPKGFSK